MKKHFKRKDASLEQLSLWDQETDPGSPEPRGSSPNPTNPTLTSSAPSVEVEKEKDIFSLLLHLHHAPQNADAVFQRLSEIRQGKVS